MLCPTCDNVNLAMADRQGIEIDYCPKCRGIWLDRGELDRLIERAEQTSVAPPPGAPVQRHDQPHARHPGHHDHREGYPNKRRKSLLGELFDF
jgi:hypothetical protein